MMTEDLRLAIERVEEDSERPQAYYGKFVIQPLERGYGWTLGNALRRVLLSSIPGAAVTCVTIEGVLHEFSTLPGMVEDVTELLLNLKELAIKIQSAGEGLISGEGPRTLRLERQGPGEVLAADIECPADVEIVNKDLHLATLDSAEARLSLTMEVERGQGYAAAEEHDNSRRPIGAIPVDSIFTPVRRVAYRVEPARVGQRTDLDRLTLEVLTNGAIEPQEAVIEAAKILDRYLILVFQELEEPEEHIAGLPAPDADEARLTQISVESLDFSRRTLNCLSRETITNVAELVYRSESDLMNIRNFGRKSLQEIKDKLASMNLSLRPSETEVPEAEGDAEEATAEE